MSASAHVLPGSRDGFRMGDTKLVDTMIVDGLWDVYNQYHMGTTAENVATKYEVSRREQDEFAAASQQKAEAAQKTGKFNDEIVPYEIASRKGTTTFAADEFVKHGTTTESLAALRPAFSKDGTVTAGNASGLNDGAAAVVMMSAKKASELGLKPLARIKAYSSAGIDPKIMGMGPVPASQLCLKKAGWTIVGPRKERDNRTWVRATKPFANPAGAAVCIRCQTPLAAGTPAAGDAVVPGRTSNLSLYIAVCVAVVLAVALAVVLISK